MKYKKRDGWNIRKERDEISIHKFGLSVCLFVCLYPINVKTAEPIGPEFFVGHLGTPGKVYEWLNFFCENPRIIFVLFYDVHKENMFTINLEDGREAPSKASIRKERDDIEEKRGMKYKKRVGWNIRKERDEI